MKTQLRQFLFGTSLGENTAMNIGWLLFRLHVGLSIAIHAGWPKMSSIAAPGWFVDQVAGLGFTFPSPGFWAVTASWGEFVDCHWIIYPVCSSTVSFSIFCNCFSMVR